MSVSTALGSERAAIVGVVDPDANAAAAYSTAWIDMSNFETLMAIVQTGAMVATSTVDAKMEQATDGSGTGVKDVTGKAITQLTAAGSDDDKQVVINIRAEELDVEGGFDFCRLTVTVATADSDSSAIVLGMGARHEPASDNDLSTVDEIV